MGQERSRNQPIALGEITPLFPQIWVYVSTLVGVCRTHYDQIIRLPVPPFRPASKHTPLLIFFEILAPRQTPLLRKPNPRSFSPEEVWSDAGGRKRERRKQEMPHIFSHLPPLKNQSLFGNVCCPFLNKTSDLRAREIKPLACLDSTGPLTS